MAMGFPLLRDLSICSKIPRFPFILLPPPRPPALRFSETIKPLLSSLSVDSISAPPDFIFLCHLELGDEDEVEQEEKVEEEDEFEEEDEIEKFKEDVLVNTGVEEDIDPIRGYFKSQIPVADPRREGRAVWRIEDVDPVELDLLDEQEQEDLELDSKAPLSQAEDGVVAEVLRIARNLPENTTLGDLLGSFAGKIGEVECMELLVRMGEEGLTWSCLYLFEWMGLQEPSLLNGRACSLLFPILGKAGMGENLLFLFENLPRDKQFKDVQVYNAAISGLSYSRRYEDAWRVFEAMEANNIQPDQVTCSILITSMRRSGRSAKDAWEFFEFMDRKGVNFGPDVYGALIKSFCDEGLKKEALLIESEMEKKGIAPSTIIYNTLMDSYSKSNQIEEAEGLFNEMKEKGLKPTCSTYNILMDAYSRRMQPRIVEDLILEMQDLGLKPDVRSYTCLISAYGRQKKMSEKATESFLRMKAAGIKPTSHSYTALIHAYSISGWQERAYAAYQRMIKEGIAPSVETYTALLDAFRRAGETKMLMEIWRTMRSNKVEGTRVTFNIVLDGLAKNGLYVQARDVLSEFVKTGFKPSVMTYNILMNAYARGGQHNKLPQLLKEMANLELRPDSITYSTMIYAYIRVRDFSRAFYYHKEMVKSGQVPDAWSYRKLRALLDVKAATKNKRDRSAMLGIINSKMGLREKRSKDALWKNRKRRIMMKYATRQ